MTKTFILILTMTFLACDKDEITTQTLNGKWKLVEYHNLTLRTSESEPTNISRSILIEFSDNGSNGKISAHTVTNSVGGEYELSKVNRIKTVRFGGTKVGEPNWGSKFWDAMYSVSSYERQRNKLFIYFNADTEKMEFSKQE